MKRKACTSEGRREVRPEQESRSDMRHNASVRQMTMRATSSPNKLQPRAPALRRPWGVIVPVTPLTGAWVGVGASVLEAWDQPAGQLQLHHDTNVPCKLNQKTLNSGDRCRRGFGNMFRACIRPPARIQLPKRPVRRFATAAAGQDASNLPLAGVKVLDMTRVLAGVSQM